MSRALLILVFALALPMSATAQSAQTPAQRGATPPATGTAGTPAGRSGQPPAATPAPGQGTLAPLEPTGYSYNPEGRRDPFVSLVRHGAQPSGSSPATRPPGLAGLNASEVSLRGTIKGRDGFVAMLEGVDKKTYLARPGDKLLDGTIRSITADTLVIVQRVNDPLSLETQREVRKMLRQTEEAK